MYIGFVNGGFDILWCEYYGYRPVLAGGLGVLPQENLEIGNALGAILSLLRVSS